MTVSLAAGFDRYAIGSFIRRVRPWRDRATSVLIEPGNLQSRESRAITHRVIHARAANMALQTYPKYGGERSTFIFNV